MRHRRILMTLLAGCLTLPAYAKPKYIPVTSGLFSTGQWYFEGQRSSLGGNAALTFVPALRYSDNFSLLPTIQSNYHGTRSAEELAGGNTLFQDTWENGANVKAVHALGNNWTLRETTGYRFKWFRETTDERWNHGLYDYNVMSVGGEIERHWGKKVTLALGYDFSYLKFPNYQSLESTQGSDRAREFAGTNVLDNRIQLISFRAKAPLFWKLGLGLQSFYSPRSYTDQHVVELSGLLTATKREDTFNANAVNLERVFSPTRGTKLVTSVLYGYSSLDSNQNHYDASLTTFVPDFYDYDQSSIGTQLTFAFGNNMGSPMLIDAGYTYSHRNYRSRVTQDVDGVYQTEKLYQIEQMISLGYSYPLARNFRVRTTASFGQSKSNNNYEAVYRYHYHNAEYQFGFTYDY